MVKNTESKPAGLLTPQKQGYLQELKIQIPCRTLMGESMLNVIFNIHIERNSLVIRFQNFSRPAGDSLRALTWVNTPGFLKQAFLRSQHAYFCA